MQWNFFKDWSVDGLINCAWADFKEKAKVNDSILCKYYLDAEANFTEPGIALGISYKFWTKNKKILNKEKKVNIVMKKVFVKLIVRFMGNKYITFDGSRVYYWKIPIIAIIPYKIFRSFRDKIIEKTNPGVIKIFYRLGILQGYNGTNILLKKYNIGISETDFRFFLDQTSFVVLGRLTLDSIDSNKCFVKLRLESNLFTEADPKKKRKQQSVIIKGD